MKHQAKRATAVDAHVGAKLRQFRREAGWSQTELAYQCGVTFQQVQKYENGSNRVSAGKLWLFARLLARPVQAFFDGYVADPSAPPAVVGRDPLGLYVTRLFDQIPSHAVRQSIVALLRSLALPS